MSKIQELKRILKKIIKNNSIKSGTLYIRVNFNNNKIEEPNILFEKENCLNHIDFSLPTLQSFKSNFIEKVQTNLVKKK